MQALRPLCFPFVSCCYKYPSHWAASSYAPVLLGHTRRFCVALDVHLRSLLNGPAVDFSVAGPPPGACRSASWCSLPSRARGNIQARKLGNCPSWIISGQVPTVTNNLSAQTPTARGVRSVTHLTNRNEQGLDPGPAPGAQHAPPIDYKNYSLLHSHCCVKADGPGSSSSSILASSDWNWLIPTVTEFGRKATERLDASAPIWFHSFVYTNAQ